MPLSFTPGASKTSWERSREGQRWGVKFTERDELLSDTLHMFDIARGENRPAKVKAVDRRDDAALVFAHDEPTVEGSAIPEVERLVSGSSHLRVSALRESQQLHGKPVLTSDDTSIHDAIAGAIRTTRWADGQACYWAVLLDQAHVALSEDEGEWIDYVVERHEYNPPDVIVEGPPRRTAEAIVESVVGMREGGERPPSSSREVEVDPIPPARLARYCETLLWQWQGACSLTVNAQGHPAFPTRAAYRRLEEALKERGRKARRLRAIARASVLVYSERAFGVHERWLARRTPATPAARVCARPGSPDGKLAPSRYTVTAARPLRSHSDYRTPRVPDALYVPHAPTLWRLVMGQNGPLWIAGREGPERWVQTADGWRRQRPYVRYKQRTPTHQTVLGVTWPITEKAYQGYELPSRPLKPVTVLPSSNVHPRKVPVTPTPCRMLDIERVNADIRALLTAHEPHQGAPRRLFGPTGPLSGIAPDQGARTRREMAR